VTDLVVLLDGVVMGHLTADGARRVSFSYSDGWMRQADATPLSTSMPVAGRSAPHRVVEPFLRGLLPDDDDVVRRWARSAGVSSASILDVLAEVGEDLPGAVQIVPPERVETVDEVDEVEWLDDEQIAAALRRLNDDRSAWHDPDDGRWSLGGAQAKIALLLVDGRWGRPHGRRATTHIIKPAIRGLVDHDLNEHMCMDAARRLGLLAAETRIVAFGDQRAIAVTRYDRLVAEDGSMIRIHQEDLCQALGVAPANKYEIDGGPTAAQIIGLFERVIADPVAKAEAIDRFIAALAFNWVVAAPDAHGKNYSLLLDRSEVYLAPLYDIASGLATADHAPKVKLAMKIGGTYRVGSITRSAWLRLATEAGLDEERVIDVVRRVVTGAAEAFSVALDALGEWNGPTTAALAAAVGVRTDACASLLDRPSGPSGS
jgi:serine/threonine-protein kinase HipA